MDSVRRSDLHACFPWRHPEGLTDEEVGQWWEQRLLDAAQMHEYFIRLEDDVLVHPRILHHTRNWSALARKDFGIGSLYFWRYGNPDGVLRDGEEQYIAHSLGLLGPGIVFRSELVPDIVERIRHRKRHGPYCVQGRFNFDTVLWDAVNDLGYRVYLRSPSLVDCRNLPSVNIPGTTPDYRARDFEEMEK